MLMTLHSVLLSFVQSCQSGVDHAEMQITEDWSLAQQKSFKQKTKNNLQVGSTPISLKNDQEQIYIDTEQQSLSMLERLHCKIS
jgi:hypothetical protein